MSLLRGHHGRDHSPRAKDHDRGKFRILQPLREVAEMSYDLNMHRQKLRGFDEAGYAWARELRDDTFVPSISKGGQ